MVSLLTEKCYPATVDCADIAVRFFGVQSEKADICSLGVDTARFHPIDSEADRQERENIRAQFGFGPSDIVCIYTGRFTKDKNPLCLARAVAELDAEGEAIRALFVGAGPQEAEIRALPGCVVHPFQPWHALPGYYRAADVGVWPAQESMSMMDAAASAIPIVISDRVQAVERVEGNGLTYREGDAGDLARALRELKGAGRRQELGRAGANKIVQNYSWLSIARRRIEDYQASVGNGARPGARATDCSTETREPCQ
jgi:glycosyltransferase involved in cell wall biosynthesis